MLPQFRRSVISADMATAFARQPKGATKGRRNIVGPDFCVLDQPLPLTAARVVGRILGAA
jgi:hypothetical protein